MQESLEKARNESSERQKAIKTLEDDMELSRKNYSAQMEVLSEHSISLKMNIERLDSLLEYIKSCEVSFVLYFSDVSHQHYIGTMPQVQRMDDDWSTRFWRFNKPIGNNGR